MALPTTNLKLHLDASDTDQLFTTFSGTGVHTGTPADGNAVQVWDDEGDGIADVCMTFPGVAGESPNFRSGTPLMLLPCLDFDGSADRLGAFVQDGNPARPLSDFVAAGAKTLALAFYPESITNTSAGPHQNHALVMDHSGFWGISLKDVTGTPTLRAFAWDGAAYDIIEAVVAANRSWVAVFRHGGGFLNLTVVADDGAVQTPSPVASGNTSDLTFQLMIGKGNSSAFYNGRIGEIAIWNDEKVGSNLTDAINYFTEKWLGLSYAAEELVGSIYGRVYGGGVFGERVM